MMPECMEILREEIALVVDAEGFTKVAFSRMKLLDSFIKESMRLHGIMIRAYNLLLCLIFVEMAFCSIDSSSGP